MRRRARGVAAISSLVHASGRPTGIAVRLAVVLLALFAVPARAVAAESADAGCLACHDDAVNADAFARSAHAGVGCTACHAEREEVPHPATAPAPDCTICHDDVVADLSASPHGTARAPGEQPPVRCADCHGSIHTLVPHTAPASPAYWKRVAATCARCHADDKIVQPFRIPVVRPVESYLDSVHARTVLRGARGAVCSDCHGAHRTLPANDPRSPLARPNVAQTCAHCHAGEAAQYVDSVHGAAVARGVRDAPSCTDCHGEHTILASTDPASPVFTTNVSAQTCGRCHGSVRMGRKYGLPTDVVTSFADSYHGLSLRSGRLSAANCASCHGVHDILPSDDPRSHIAPERLVETCGQCHPGAGVNFALGPVHVVGSTTSAGLVRWIRGVYLWLIGLVVGGMLVHNALDLARKMRRQAPPPRTVPEDQPERMPRALRLQHGIVMVTFPVLVYTGFALTYPESWWAAPLLTWEGELGIRGSLHRAAGAIMLVALAWHLLELATNAPLRRCFRAMLPSWRDVRDVGAAFGWYLGFRPTPPHPGTFGYIEKAEYWAFLWGSGLMAITGFVLWFENVALRWLPKWVTDVATALHFYEAALATLAILVWHLYWVVFDPDVYPMDASWWHGRSPAARVAERRPHPDDEFPQED